MHISRYLGLFIIGVIIVMLAACNEPLDMENESNEQNVQEQEQEQEQEQGEQGQSEQDQDEPQEGMPPTALEAAATVIATLKDKDMNKLSSWAHPEKGIRFSPYAFVDIEKDLVFSKDELKNMIEDTAKYEWGTFAGSGEPIKMTYAEYHEQFIYNVDFIDKAEIALNEELGQGNTINNLNEVYPPDSHDFVEHHIEGINPDYEGMDWCSLRLVFEKMGNDRVLVGIIHDEWTP